ncbi:hypothetical protein EO087_02430 [Dyella sp. M7H15-1]|uniref:hypothetical protein n=1 Tax=Dyella sp. M7H15-1 TaxID=2501295 RepID=UPI001004FE0A|nr:hypothetical protein [Dyella sp. M7H15-1]QAU22985.1 hypothetical protein EO087_02430 [Dyella sp. M7H15-1]
MEKTILDASDVGQMVILVVDDATIRAAGDSDALVLRYQVYDIVHNRSGWSPTTDVVVNVQGNALFLPEVTNADANGVIDLALLGSEDVRVLVTAFEPDFAVGDTVTLYWLGHTAEGVSVPYEAAQSVTRGPIQTLEFLVPNANVAALAQGDAVVSYALQNDRTSKQVRVTIVGQAASLPAPTVDEASNDYDELSASVSRATVRIPPYPGMDAGDVVTLIWSGTRADGEAHLYQVERQISGSAVGKDIVLQIPGAEIALLAGGTVELWYDVIMGDGTPLRPSQVRTLRVSSGQDIFLPQPSVDEAPDGVTLDPAAVDLYATVRIAPYAGMAIDDRVDLYWVGSGVGGSTSDWITVRAATLNKPLLFDVDKAYVTVNDGGTVTVRYAVTPKGGSPRPSTPLKLLVSPAQAIIPVITSVSDSTGDIPDGGITHDTTVTVSGTAIAGMTVELFDNETISRGIAPVDNAGLWIRAVTGLADGNHRFTATGLYGSEPVSPAWSFTVLAALVGLAAPIVTEADPFTNTLNLVKPINGVHIVIDYPGMAPNDVVTMIWQGTEGGGSQQQATKVEVVGPIIFTVDNPTIDPNTNRTVQIFYTVKRAGEPAVESPVLNLAIHGVPNMGLAPYFIGGTTSFYRCTARSSITIPEDLPIGAVIDTTSPISPSGWTAIYSWAYQSRQYLSNAIGGEPAQNSTLFSTGIPGVGFRLIFNGSAWPAGPAVYPSPQGYNSE